MLLLTSSACPFLPVAPLTPAVGRPLMQNQVADSQNRTASDMQEARAGIETLLARSSLSVSKPKLPPVPAGAPTAKGWHIVRDTLVDDMYAHFVAKDSPWMVGLVGRSGSGKSTAAALVVGDGMKVLRPQHGETHEQALARLHRVRALFPDGVAWLRVGRDAEERLPGLMQDLAKTVYEDVLDSRGYPPGQSPIDPKNGVAYVQHAMAEGGQGQAGLQCLLVADDVWQSEVLEELRKTGMRVLLTTRDPTLVTGAGGKVIVCEKLRKEEAKALLTSAAELPEGACLPNAAHSVLDLCDYMPMYVESVARWTMLKGRRDEGPWSKAIAVIQRHLRDIQTEKNNGSRQGLGASTGDDPGSSGSSSADKRIAILRAGFECLGAEGAESRRLYLALAVMPGGHAFEVYEAAVLLFGHEHTEHDLEQAGQVVASLERWAILTVAGPGLYHMHDARSDFARRALMDAPAYVREEAVEKWQAHLSTLEVARSVEVYDLLELWQAVEHVGGGELRASHPYDSAMVALEMSDPVYLRSAGAVAELYNQDGDFQGAAALMRRIWERCAGNPAANPAVSLTSLWHCIHGAILRGDEEERRHLARYMEPLLQCAIQLLETIDASPAEKAYFIHGIGLCCSSLERMGEAERWFLRALEAQKQAHLDADHAHVASTRNQLARCLLTSGRLEEAETLFRQALESREARLGINAMPVSRTLTGLAKCVLQMGRAKEAELLFRRVLAIQKSRLGVEHVEVAHTLGDLAECSSQQGQAGDAEALSRQALETKEANSSK